MNLAKNFTLEEFTRSETARRLGIDNTPSEENLKNLKVLATQVLQPARDEMGEPLTITSGFRSRKLNRAVGGVYNSYHQFGQAADIACTDEKFANRLGDALIKQQLTDLVLIEFSKHRIWVHVQWSRVPRHLINRRYET